MISVATHCLVYWLEEDSVAVVKRQQVQGGDEEIGEERNVKWGKKCYKAKVAAVGKLLHT